MSNLVVSYPGQKLTALEIIDLAKPQGFLPQSTTVVLPHSVQANKPHIDLEALHVGISTMKINEIFIMSKIVQINSVEQYYQSTFEKTGDFEFVEVHRIVQN